MSWEGSTTIDRVTILLAIAGAVMEVVGHLTESMFLANAAYQLSVVALFPGFPFALAVRPRRVTRGEESLLRRGATWYLRRVCSCVSLWVFMQCPIGGLLDFYSTAFPCPADQVQRPSLAVKVGTYRLG